MKKIYLLIISLIIIIPSKTNALSNYLSLECDSTKVSVNTKVSCKLYANTDSKLSALEGKLSKSDGLVVSNISVPNIWNGDFENNSLLIYTDANKSNKVEILNFDVTSNTAGTYKIDFIDTYFVDSTFDRNKILDSSFTLEFVNEVNSNTLVNVIEDEKNIVIADTLDNGKANEDNPKTGGFLPICLIILLSSLGGLIFVKTKARKLFKL